MSNNTKQHDKDMRKFQKEYEKTKADVWKKTRHFELRSQKRAVLGVLVFIVLLGMFLAAEVSSGYMEKVSRRWKASRNYERTCSQMEIYLDEGAYGDLFEYGEYYHLTDSESGKFASWYPILWCAWRYDVTEKAAEDLAKNAEISLDRIYDGNITYFADTLAAFYRETYEDAENAENPEVFETMQQRMAEVLKETLPLTEEEISELDGMTSARISKLLREGYGLE